ncbi:hypothetical protein [Halopiger aswanensis]|nr:hypothetical protein [Halopiger aswanensis]
MRFASETSSSIDPKIDAVDVPPTASIHDDVGLRWRINNANEQSSTREVSAVVTVDNQPVTQKSLALEAESNATIETTITPTEPGEHNLAVVVENEDGERLARWTGTLTVLGRTLTLDWDTTFVPATHAASASDTRHLAYACFLVQCRRGDTVIAEYEVGNGSSLAFISGAYPPEPITDARLETFDGTQGRWLGTEEEQTVVAVPDSEVLAEAETLELHGYSLLETTTTVTVSIDERGTIDTAPVPTRDDGEAVLEIDVTDDDG